MNWLEFVSSAISALAWPTAVLAIAITFRKSFTRLLNGLCGLKFKDFEVDFGKELNELEVAAISADIRPDPRPTGAAVATSPSGPRKFRTLQEEVESVAEISPAAAIPLAWAAIENELFETVKRLAVSPDYPAWNSATQNLEYLKSAGQLNDSTVRILNGMRVLRNKAVHGHKHGETVTTNEAMEYAKLAQTFIERLQSLRRK